MQDNLVYFLYGKPYINITNACTNACLFCVRSIKDDVVGAKLWLEEKNITSSDVIEQIRLNKDKIKDEIVFCGYGEPLIKLNEVIEVSKYLRENFPGIKIRINTNGHGSYINNKNAAKGLKGLIDSVSVSLNAQDEKLYNEISQPKFKNAYEEMLKFCKECINEGIETTMTVVSNYEKDGRKYDIDIEKCAKIANDLGAKFRVREWIKEGY